jgi:hypothetical protein
MTPHEQLEQRVAAIEKEMPTIRSSLKENTDITQSVKSDTADLVEFVRGITGLTIFAKWVGKSLQWMAPIALAAVGLWAALKGVKQP